jgi:hypothetical protein
MWNAADGDTFPRSAEFCALLNKQDAMSQATVINRFKKGEGTRSHDNIIKIGLDTVE